MTPFSWLQEYIMNELRGVLSGKLGTGMCGPGSLFGLSGSQMAFFLFENWFRNWFAKCLIFYEFFLWRTYRLSKSTYASRFTWQKVLICLKKGPSRNKWLRHRLKIFVFSGLVIGWWLKLWAGHQYPIQIWVPPPPRNELVMTGLCVFNSAGNSHLYSLFKNE